MQSLEIWSQTATDDGREVVQRPPAPGGQSNATVHLRKITIGRESRPATAESRAAVRHRRNRDSGLQRGDRRPRCGGPPEKGGESELP